MKPYLWAIITALVWGMVPVIEKIGLSKVDVVPGLFIRCMGVILGVVLILAFKFTEIKNYFSNASPGWQLLILGGFLASVVGQLFFYQSLKYGEASKVVPIAATYPLISFVLGIIFLKEGVTLAKMGGMVFVLVGVFLLK